MIMPPAQCADWCGHGVLHDYPDVYPLTATTAVGAAVAVLVKRRPGMTSDTSAAKFRHFLLATTRPDSYV